MINILTVNFQVTVFSEVSCLMCEKSVLVYVRITDSYTSKNYYKYQVRMHVVFR